MRVPIAMKSVFDLIDTFQSRIKDMEKQKKNGIICKEDRSSLENFLSRYISFGDTERKAGEHSDWANENPRETRSRRICAGWPSLWEGSVCLLHSTMPSRLFLSAKWLWLQGWLGSVPSSVDLVALDKSFLSLLLFWDTDAYFWPSVRVNSFSPIWEALYIVLIFIGPFLVSKRDLEHCLFCFLPTLQRTKFTKTLKRKILLTQILIPWECGLLKIPCRNSGTYTKKCLKITLLFPFFIPSPCGWKFYRYLGL